MSFGKRGSFGTAQEKPAAAPATRVVEATPVVASAAKPAPAAAARPAPPPAPEMQERRKSDSYYDTKSSIFSALIETIDLSQLAKLDIETAREEIRDIVGDIITLKAVVMSISE